MFSKHFSSGWIWLVPNLSLLKYFDITLLRQKSSKIESTLKYSFPELDQITWWFVCWQKTRAKKCQKTRAKTDKKPGPKLSSVGVGAQGQLTRASNGLSPRTKYKRSKNALAVTSIALSLGCLGTQSLQLPVQSLIGSLLAKILKVQ